MGAIEFLADVAQTVRTRGEEYGDAARLFADIARRWSAVLGFEVSPAQVALCMIDVKLARLSHDPTHADSARDIAGYAAILSEITQ
jgi:hypothetical protein